MPPGTKLIGGFSGTETQSDARQKDSRSTFDALGNTCLFIIEDGIVPVEIESLAIRGARRGDGTLRGAIHVARATVVVQNCTIENNSTAGLYCSNGRVTLTDSTFRQNAGPGIELVFSRGSPSNISRTDFIENTSDGHGAGINCYQSDLHVRDSSFSNNQAGQGGGAINIDRGSVIIRKCLFTNNTARSDGGGMRITQGANVGVCWSVFSENRSAMGGGAFVDTFSLADFVNCAFIRNLAVDKGGGAMTAYIDPEGHTSFANCIFLENTAGMGGGLTALGGASPTLVNCTIFRNRSTHSRAGALVVFEGRPSVRNSILLENTPDPFLKEQITLEPGARIQVSDSLIEGGFRSATAIYDGAVNFWDPSRPLACIFHTPA